MAARPPMEWGKFLLSMSLGHSSTRTEEHLGRHFSLGAFLFGGEKHFPSTACVRAPCQHWENRLLALASSPFWNIPLLLSNHRNTRTRHRSPFLWVFRQGEITGASSNTGPSRGMTSLQGDCCPSPHSLLSSVGCWRHRFAVTSHLNLYNCARKLQGMKARQCLQSHWHSQSVFPRLTPFCPSSFRKDMQPAPGKSCRNSWGFFRCLEAHRGEGNAKLTTG